MLSAHEQIQCGQSALGWRTVRGYADSAQRTRTVRGILADGPPVYSFADVCYFVMICYATSLVLEYMILMVDS